MLAFTFSERWAGGEKPWGTYFTPVGTAVNEHGTVIEYPSIQSVDEEILEYWLERGRKTKHPVLRARYAGLVWDFSPKVINQNAPIDMAQIHIDAVVEMANIDAHTSAIDVFHKLGHALNLAIRINDQIRIKIVRNAIIGFQRKVAVDDKAGLWVPAFNLLCCNKKSQLTEDQRETIIQDLEDRLERLSSASPVNPWGAEKAGLRLARHYQGLGKQDDVKRVLLKVGRAFDPLVRQADPLLAQSWLRKVHDLYKRFELHDETDALRKRICELGPETQNSLVEISAPIEIKKEDMDRCINSILEGDLQTAILRFIIKFIPQRADTKELLQALSKDSPIMFLGPINIMDHKGRPVATVGSINDDLNGRIMMQTRQKIGIEALLLREVIKEMISRFDLTVDAIVGWIDGSPVFDPSRRVILERGLKAYFDSDALLALHLLVPQIENAIRELVELAGGDVYRPNPAGGMDLRSMDDLLRDQITINMLSNDGVEYLRILYTDRRGINLRNKICHGMMPANSFDNSLADRVFHTIVMLSWPGQSKGDDSKE